MFFKTEILDKNIISIIIVLAIIFHISASYFSIGWYGADEQSCILEYLNNKNGFESKLSSENIFSIEDDSIYDKL